MTDLINFKTKTALEQDLLIHFQKCDHQFSPALSQRVNLNDYAKKLYEYAEIFEAWSNKNLIGVISVYLNDAIAGLMKKAIAKSEYQQALQHCLQPQSITLRWK